jgi:hypothetical protein
VIDITSLDSLLLLLGIITVPAIIIFSVMTYLRLRNTRFRHQRSNRRRHESEK